MTYTLADVTKERVCIAASVYDRPYLARLLRWQAFKCAALAERLEPREHGLP